MWYALVASKDPNIKIVAISDSKQAIYDESGLNVSDQAKNKNETRKLNGELLENRDDILGLDVDVLVLAALEDSITKDNMGDIKAEVILELANGPLSFEAYEHLAEQGVQIIPDVVANAGGVLVSYFEWQQNMKGEKWSEERVNEMLKEYMQKATNQMWEYSQNKSIPLKASAFDLSIERLV